MWLRSQDLGPALQNETDPPLERRTARNPDLCPENQRETGLDLDQNLIAAGISLDQESLAETDPETLRGGKTAPDPGLGPGLGPESLTGPGSGLDPDPVDETDESAPDLERGTETLTEDDIPGIAVVTATTGEEPIGTQSQTSGGGVALLLLLLTKSRRRVTSLQ